MREQALSANPDVRELCTVSEALAEASASGGAPAESQERILFDERQTLETIRDLKDFGVGNSKLDQDCSAMDVDMGIGNDSFVSAGG